MDNNIQRKVIIALTIAALLILILSIRRCSHNETRLEEKEKEISTLITGIVKRDSIIKLKDGSLEMKDSLLSMAYRTINTQRRVIETQKTTIATQEKKIHHLNKEIDRIASQFANHKKLTDEELIEKSIAMTSLKNERDNLIAKQSKMEQDLMNSDAKLKILEEKKANLEAEIASMTQEITDLTVVHTSFENTVQGLTLILQSGGLTNANGKSVTNNKNDHWTKSKFRLALSGVDIQQLQGRLFFLELVDINQKTAVEGGNYFEVDEDGHAIVELSHQRLKSANYKLRLYYVPVPNKRSSMVHCPNADTRVLVGNTPKLPVTTAP